ncbi:MAG: hypothetical protein IJC83_04505 [Oscillospiraceae bacterium]|nr:hypothetical protein [Oscillospiraceae bacterium]
MNINHIINQGNFRLPSPTINFLIQPNANSKIESNESQFLLNNCYDTVELKSLGVADLFEKLGESEGLSISSIGDMPAKESTKFTNEEVSESARYLSALMNENGNDICTKVFFGMSETQLADHFGNIGKQIDNAFSNGEITKQEYDDLNLGLANYTEAICVKAERSTAMWEVVKQNVQALSAKFMGGVSSNETDSEKISETLHNRITEFVEEYCSINRSLLNTLIARVRSGENLLPEGTVQTYNRENTAGYFKNNYKPFVPVKLI